RSCRHQAEAERAENGGQCCRLPDRASSHCSLRLGRDSRLIDTRGSAQMAIEDVKRRARPWGDPQGLAPLQCYGMQRVTVPPPKLICGGEAQVALAAPVGPVNMLGSTF